MQLAATPFVGVAALSHEKDPGTTMMPRMT